MNHGLNLQNGPSIEELRELSLLGLPLRTRTHEREGTHACGNYVLVFPLPNVYPQGAVSFGQPRADRSCVLIASAALQFLRFVRDVGCPWYIETVQNAAIRRKIDEAESAADEQTWRSTSAEMYRIWAVLDAAQMKMVSALYRTQLNTLEAQPDNDAMDADPAGGGRRSRKRKRDTVSPLSVASDPAQMCVSSEAIKSVHRLIEVWNLLVGGGGVPRPREVEYDLTAAPVNEGTPATTQPNGAATFGGVDLTMALNEDVYEAEEEDEEDGADAHGPGEPAPPPAETHPRGTLKLPSNHVLYALQADVVFASRSHGYNMKAGNVLNVQRRLSNYFAGEGHRLRLEFDMFLGGPVRSHMEFEWLDQVDELKRFGLPDRAEPDFAAASDHLSRAAFTSCASGDGLPTTHEELLDMIEDGTLVDSTHLGNPWVIPTGTGAGDGEMAGETWAPNVDILQNKIYGGLTSAKRMVARMMTMITEQPGTDTDAIEVALKMAHSAWTKVFNTPGDTVPQVFEQVHRHTRELIEALRTPKSKAAKYAKSILDGDVTKQMRRIRTMLGLPAGTDVKTVTFGTVDTVWLWSLFKIWRLSNQQTGIAVVIRRLQGAIAIIETTGANMQVTLYGDFAVGKSKAMETAAAALWDCCISAITNFSNQADLDIVTHCMQVIDDAAQSSQHNSIKFSLFTQGVGKAKRNVPKPEAKSGYETEEQVGVMRGVLRVLGCNFSEHRGMESRSVAIMHVSKEAAAPTGGSIAELASGAVGSAATLGAGMIMRLETGMFFRFWSVVAMMGPVDDTMFQVAIAATRAAYKAHGKDLDKILGARAIGHTKKMAQGILGTQVARYYAFKRRHMSSFELFKCMLADRIMRAEHAMQAITMQAMQRSEGVDAMCNHTAGGIKRLVQTSPGKTEVCYDEADDKYVNLTVTGRSSDAVLSALVRVIKDHPRASIEPAYQSICNERGADGAGVDVVRFSSKDSRWSVHRSAIFRVDAMSTIERDIWKAIAIWVHGAMASGMTTGLVKLSYCGTKFVLTNRAVDMLRRPHTFDDAPSVIKGYGDDVMLPALTIMNQCDNGLQLSPTREGELALLTEDVATFLDIETDDRCVACGADSIERAVLGKTGPLYKKKLTVTGCASISRVDFDAVERMIKGVVTLPPPLVDAWQMTLRAEGAVKDGSVVGVTIDPNNSVTGTLLLTADYGTITKNTVPTPGFSADAASAFEAESDTIPNTVLPVGPLIDTTAAAQYSRKSREAAMRKYNLDPSHFCPIDVAEYMARHA